MTVLVVAWGLRPAPEPGWLGVTLDKVTHEGRPAARLAKILGESPALQIGLVAGDLVLGACGRRVGPPRDLVGIVRSSAPGTRCTLTIERAGARQSLQVTLAARPPDLYELLERDRDPWQEPARVLDLLAVVAGGAVADLGAGSGYFTERLAARVGDAGRVVAVDVDEDALALLRTRFPRHRFPQVEIHRGTATDPDLAPGSLDAVLLVDTYHELTDPGAILHAIRLALRPHGRLVIVDRNAAEYRPDTHTIPEARVVEQVEAAGFARVERHDLQRQFALVLQ